jgi:hypothetical protein
MFLVLTLVQTAFVFGVLPAAVIFSAAGRWDLWNVWAYVGIVVGLSLFRDLAMYRISPDLLKERIRPAARGRGQGFLGVAFVLLMILFFSVAGLDQRFHWSDRVPLAGWLPDWRSSLSAWVFLSGRCWSIASFLPRCGSRRIAGNM